MKAKCPVTPMVNDLTDDEAKEYIEKFDSLLKEFDGYDDEMKVLE